MDHRTYLCISPHAPYSSVLYTPVIAKETYVGKNYYTP